MLLVTQNATSRFAEEVYNCLINRASTRCVVLQLSKIPDKPKHWALSTVSIIEECLGGEGSVYFTETGDVMIIDRSTTRKAFVHFIRRLSERLGAADLRKLAFQYELPVDGEAVAALLGTKKAISGSSIARTKVANLDAARDSLTRNLINTIGIRREKRTVPQILIVEDDPFFQRLIGGLFTKAFRMTIAKSGADALDLYIQAAPDLVLLNIGLPDISGFEVLRNILDVDPYAHVVMLSAQGSRDNVVRTMHDGAKGFVAKPFTSHTLMSHISNCPFIQDKRLEVSNRRTHLNHGRLIEKKPKFPAGEASHALQ